ncbi:F-actin-uncapping protein LRRC16A-like isoform X2 [Festucalex cinctus]
MEPSDFSKELLESVQEAAGRSLKLSLRCQVQLEVKGEKVDNKVLALSSHRGFLLSARIPAKVEHSFSYLDIQHLRSNKPTQMLVECQRGPCTLWFSSQKDSDQVIGHIGSCLTRICSDMNPTKKFEVTPSERWLALRAVWEQRDAADAGPCGGFSDQYRAVCDNLNLVYREEVQWDVDTIYLSQDTTELNLHDFSHLDSRDLVAIVGALEHNRWFTKLLAKDCKLSADVCEQILRVVSRSTCLEELVLDNVGLRSDFAHKLALALSHNPASSLHTLNLSNNSLEDKGMCALGAQLGKLAMGLKDVNLSRTSLSPKGEPSAARVRFSHPAHGACGRQGSTSCARRCAPIPAWPPPSRTSSWRETRSKGTSCRTSTISSVATTACKFWICPAPTALWNRKCREVPASFKQFFSLCRALISVNVSGCRLPPEALKALLLGLGCNPNLSDVSLDLSGCELRSAGSQILEGCVAEIPNISSLDISDNGLDGDLSTLLVWLAKNRSVRHLSLGRNFHNIKSKNVAGVLHQLVRMLQEEESPLTSLSLADSKLKGDLALVLNALGGNASLTALDISGNAMGDMGAKMLAKALQINTKLRTLAWDRNNVSPRGLQEVASALEKNFTIRFMPVPIMDAAQALKTNPEKTEEALLKMERFLLRNHESRKYLQEQAYRLQQGIVASTTQQMMDSVCVKVQDHLNSLAFCHDRSVRDDVRAAENMMADARNSKTLLPRLYHLGGGGLRGAVQDKLESVAAEVAAVMDEQLQATLAAMLEAASALCPHVMTSTGALAPDLLRAGAGKMSVPRAFIAKTLLEQTGVDILNKISELKLGAASLISDRIVDRILDSLSTWRHTLAAHVSRQGQPALRPESPEETQVVDETPLHRHAHQAQADPRAMSKRRSILVRMQRPVSLAFEMDFDLDKALQEVPVHAADAPPSPSPSSPAPDLGPAFPPLGSPPPLLRHHTKARPKARRRTKPSRVAPPQGAEHQGMMGNLDEGVDDFFSKKVLKVSSKRLSAQATPSNQPPDKKRESRRSGFFNLIRGRASSSSRSEKNLPASPPAPASTPPPGADESPPSLSRESLRAPSRAIERSETDASASPPAEEEKDGPPPARRRGVPIMAADLLAEIKARQEKMAAVKLESPKEDDRILVGKSELSVLAVHQEVHPNVGADSDRSRPESAPRSKGPAISPTSPPPASVSESSGLHLGSIRPDASTSEAGQVPLPAPRLRRAPSGHELERSDGRRLSNATVPAVPSPRRRRSSSLQTSPRRRPDVRRRAKSLPSAP